MSDQAGAVTGEQLGLTWKSVKRVDIAWNRSRFGVLRIWLPMQDKSPMPWSSVITRMMFGRDPRRPPAAFTAPL